MWLVEMAKLVLLLLFVCFQFSSQEELGKAEIELVKPEITTVTELLDGADKNQWGPEKETNKTGTEWTDEDEKWLDEKLNALNSEEFDILMEELDKYFGESDESDEDWLYDSEEWLDDDDWDLYNYPEYYERKEGVSKGVKDDKDLYYSWLYKLQIQDPNNKKRQPAKRFTSV